MPATKTEAIKNFLTRRTHADLAALYNHDMEVQVVVAQDEGTRAKGEEYLGHKYFAYTDGQDKWSPFRIPWKAKTEPEYKDAEIRYNLDDHAEGIGLTGWDWQNKVSRFFAYDFDSLIGHAESHDVKLTPEELLEVEEKATSLPYVTVRQSTGGSGLHLYVFLETPEPTQNHNEHAALARAIIQKMSFDTGFDFEASVDVCGHVIWFWARKMDKTDKGLVLLHQGEPLKETPREEIWRSNLNVISRKKNRASVELIDSNDQVIYDQTASHRPRVDIEEEHKTLIKFLEEQDEFVTWYEQDEQRLVTHTIALANAHKELKLKGIFETGSSGSTQHNCFCYPLARGGWVVRRFGQGVRELDSWEKDAGGWTRCLFNMQPVVRTACVTLGGVETMKGDFEFSQANEMVKSAAGLGVEVEIPSSILENRKAWVSDHKDGRLVVQIDAAGLENAGIVADGWILDKKRFTRIYDKDVPVDMVQLEVEKIDNFLRYVVTLEGAEIGWYYSPPNCTTWTSIKKDNIKNGLYNLGYKKGEEANDIFGLCVNNPWIDVAEPFKPEYPGNRKWNRKPVNFVYPLRDETAQLNYPTWMKILNHVGSNLTPVVREDPWCKENNVLTGGEFLKLWCAWMFQKPEQRIPYLFFYSLQQHTGKTTFHEQLGTLMTEGVGHVKAESVLQESFSDPLRHGILCAIEELDLSTNKNAYNRVKNYTTSQYVAVRELYKPMFQIKNRTHWVQTANRLEFLPIEPDDTRIIVVLVEPIEGTMTTEDLRKNCDKEASDFLTALLTLDLPPTPLERMALPVLSTPEKARAEEAKRTVLEKFLAEFYYYCPGNVINDDVVYDHFMKEITPNERTGWNKERLIDEMPFESYPRGTHQSINGKTGFANIRLIADNETALIKKRLILNPKGRNLKYAE